MATVGLYDCYTSSSAVTGLSTRWLVTSCDVVTPCGRYSAPSHYLNLSVLLRKKCMLLQWKRNFRFCIIWHRQNIGMFVHALNELTTYRPQSWTTCVGCMESGHIRTIVTDTGGPLRTHKDQFSLIQYHIISRIANMANVINLCPVRLEVRSHSCFQFYLMPTLNMLPARPIWKPKCKTWYYAL